MFLYSPHGPQPKADRGSIAVIAAVIFVPLSMMLAVVVDSGRVWVGRSTLHNGVEAAAVAVATTWSNGSPGCSPEDLSFVSHNGAQPDDVTCDLSGTPRAGLVKVAASEQVPMIFAGLLGRPTAEVRSSTTVKIGAPSSLKGLWPFGLCWEHDAVTAWLATEMTAPMIAEITFASDGANCGGKVSGNWSVLNFEGGSSSNAVIKQWVLNGYDGWVAVSDEISGNPGVPSSSLNIAEAYGNRIILPLFDNPRLQGSNSIYRIRGFAIARLLEARFTGPSAQRSLTIQFESGMVSGGVGNDSSPFFGATSWAVCSFDSYGDC
jgi:hypothetical protein